MLNFPSDEEEWKSYVARIMKQHRTDIQRLQMLQETRDLGEHVKLPLADLDTSGSGSVASGGSA